MVHPPVGNLAHCVELIPAAAPSFVPRRTTSKHLEKQIEQEADELIRKRPSQPSASVFGYDPVLGEKKDGRWSTCAEFKNPPKS